MISYPSLVKNYASYFDSPVRKNYLSLGVTLFTLIVLLLMIYPAVFYVLDINNQLTTNREIDQLLSKKISDLGKAKQNLETLSSGLREIDSALPNSAEVASYLKDLEQELSSNQTVVASIQVDETQLQGGSVKGSPQIIPLSYSLTISGSFDNLKSALDRLEKLARFTDITSASFSAKTELGEDLRLVLKAKTYFYTTRDIKASGDSQ